jgi:hypothetical protein
MLLPAVAEAKPFDDPVRMDKMYNANSIVFVQEIDGPCRNVGWSYLNDVKIIIC